jgi:hypothetical protein
MCILKKEAVMESETRPELVEVYIIYATRRYFVNIDLEKIDNMYRWEQVEIPAGKFDYSGVVDALVQYKYPIDKMQAVINNYLLDPEDEAVVKEFNNMQMWRKEAKKIAKQALDYKI